MGSTLSEMLAKESLETSKGAVDSAEVCNCSIIIYEYDTENSPTDQDLTDLVRAKCEQAFLSIIDWLDNKGYFKEEGSDAKV